MASAPIPEVPQKGKKKAVRAGDEDHFKLDDFHGSRPEMMPARSAPLFVWYFLLGLIAIATAVFIWKRFF